MREKPNSYQFNSEATLDWIKTAARGKGLTSLDHTIREGNSVISDPAVHPRAFDWQAAFPEVFAQGGFDVVILFVYP